MKKRNHLVTLLLLVFAACASSKQATKQEAASKLVLLSQYDIPFNSSYNGTTVGGLSSIDYNAENDEYYLICDDRSLMNPARFYTAKINIEQGRIDTVYFTASTFLKQTNGQIYPNTKEDPQHTPDPESMRWNKETNQLVWTSEGERIVSPAQTTIANPFIHIIKKDGSYVDSFALPRVLHMSTEQQGPRQNGVLEGAAFSGDFKHLFVSVEEPLFQDGPRASVEPTDAWIRLLKFDVKRRTPIAQYAYKLEPVAYPSTPPDGFQVNGVPEILYLDKNRILVIERSFSTGRLACTIKVFLANVSQAEDISGKLSLIEQAPIKPAIKRLLLNMDTLGIYTDNIEGVTFGPTLPNGHKTLLFVADNNFSKTQTSQFLLFEFIP